MKLKSILPYKHYLIMLIGVIVSVGILFLPLGSEEFPLVGKLFSVIVFMGTFWIFEVIPIPVTSLFPIVLFPVFEILDQNTVVKSYLNDSQALFFGSFTLAFAMERWKLHQRIALFLLRLQGDKPRILFMSFLLITAVLSMFISNSAACSLMVPIVITLLGEVELQLVNQISPNSRKIKEREGEEIENSIKEEESQNVVVIELKEFNHQSENELENNNLNNINNIENNNLNDNNNSINNNNNNNNDNDDKDNDKDKNLNLDKLTSEDIEKHKEIVREFRYYKIGLLIGISYSATIGGFTTLIGTPPNLIMLADIKTLFPEAPEITFLNWFLFCLPLSTVMIISCFYILAIGPHCNLRSKLSFDKSFFQKEYQKLGKISKEEIMIFILFAIVIIIWFSKSGFGADSFFPGWTSHFPNVGYGTTSVFFAILLFIIPSPSLKYKEPLLRWKDLLKFPWETVILMGAGYTIATAFTTSNAQNWIAQLFERVGSVPLVVLIFFICVLTSFITEFSSNVAIASIFIPAVAAIAVSLNENPFFTIIPCTIASSFAFMLPIATPGNSIVFASGEITIPMMAKRGFFLNGIGVFAVTIYSVLAIPFFFDAKYGEVPPWSSPSS